MWQFFQNTTPYQLHIGVVVVATAALEYDTDDVYIKYMATPDVNHIV